MYYVGISYCRALLVAGFRSLRARLAGGDGTGLDWTGLDWTGLDRTGQNSKRGRKTTNMNSSTYFLYTYLSSLNMLLETRQGFLMGGETLSNHRDTHHFTRAAGPHATLKNSPSRITCDCGVGRPTDRPTDRYSHSLITHLVPSTWLHHHNVGSKKKRKRRVVV